MKLSLILAPVFLGRVAGMHPGLLNRRPALRIIPAPRLNYRLANLNREKNAAAVSAAAAPCPSGPRRTVVTRREKGSSTRHFSHFSRGSRDAEGRRRGSLAPGTRNLWPAAARKKGRARPSDSPGAPLLLPGQEQRAAPLLELFRRAAPDRSELSGFNFAARPCRNAPPAAPR